MSEESNLIINPADDRAARFRAELASGDKSNLLLFTDTEHRASHSNWNKAVDRVTPKGTKKKNWVEDTKDTGAREADNVKREFALNQIVSMPPNFCIYCGDTDVPKEKQKARLQIIFNRDVSGLDLREGSVANASACSSCTHAIFFEQRESVVPDIPETEHYWTSRRLDRHSQALDNICTFIWAQRQAGVEGTIFGDDVRRERYKDLNE